MKINIWKSNKLALLFHFERWCANDSIKYNEFRIYFLFWEINILL